MLQPDSTATWIGVAIIVAIVVVLTAVAAVRRRRHQDFDVRPLPAERAEPYTRRLDDLERMFVTQPRQALAGVRQAVDEMLALKGYPARLGPDGRARDIASTNRGHASRYRSAAVVDDRSTTEEMRQAMEHLLSMGRELVAESAETGTRTPAPTPPPLPDDAEASRPAPEGEPVREQEPAGKRERTLAG
jgi:cell division septation protein DedD